MEISIPHKISKLITCAESKALDDYAIREWKMNPTALMSSAASSIFQSYRHKAKDKIILSICGSGNNGGDGLAIAYFFHQLGNETIIYMKSGKHSKEFLYYYNLVKQANIPVYDIKEFQYNHHKYQNKPVLLIDAILGIGFKPPISEELDSYITSINDFRKSSNQIKILSIDTPSGYSIDLHSNYIVPDYLAEIGSQKISNEFQRQFVTEYSFHPIGFPMQEFFEISLNQASYYKLKPYSISEIYYYSKRSIFSHKYSNGSACFIGGSDGMGGAIFSAGTAFHKMGGGISKIYSPSTKVLDSIFQKDTSYMAMKLDSGILSDSFFKKSYVSVIGPGLEHKDLPLDVHSLIHSNKHYIIDAGGLDLVKQVELNEHFILTPHPGEFTRLIDASHSTVGELIEQVRQYCLSCKVYMVYRGSLSIVGSPDGSIYIWNYPNPKLAIMGTGDIFAGILSYYISKKYTSLLSIHLTLSTMHLCKNMQSNCPTAKEILDYITGAIHEE